ncbi:MAG: DUF302 domain-containing protein [archaeon]
MNDIAIEVNTSKNFDEAVVSVLQSVDKQGWALFQIYDIKERLAAKGFEFERLKIIEICSAKHASRLLKKNKLASLCMPCKINVIETKGKVTITGMNPLMITEIFPDITKQDVAAVEADIRMMVEGSA